MPLKSMKLAWPSAETAERVQRMARSPVSDLERAQLEAFRATPSLETHLTPNGTVTKDVTTRVEVERERRIGYINKRLARQKSQARDGFNRGR